MTVYNFNRVYVVGTSELNISNIRNFIMGNIDSDVYMIQWGIDILPTSPSTTKDTMIDLYLEGEYDITKYANMLEQHINQIEKQGISSISIYKVEGYSTNKGSETKINEILQYEWTA